MQCKRYTVRQGNEERLVLDSDKGREGTQKVVKEGQ
jgi:hypothetical protein